MNILLPLLLTAPPVGIAAPDGFAVRPFSGPELATDIYTLAISKEGRIAVAGRGYVRELIDADNDGTAEKAVELVAGLKDGPMGLLWEGDTLFVVVDGGLWKLTGVGKGQPVALKSGERLLALKTGGEHDAHAVRRGPDGALYVLCGNSTGISAKHVTDPTSPVKDPIAGVLLRLDPKTNAVAVYAHGFRNPYDFDFAADGTPHTFDSDNERCVGLPWYEGCRFYRIPKGGHHGWLNPQFTQTWRMPPYFPDVVTPLCQLGRGSPTGVACNTGSAFPDHYRYGFFLADWTFGKVWFVNVYVPRPVPFLTATGESGFAPTGLAVHPKTGELFVSVGGRGTRGAVYRVTYSGPKVVPQPRFNNIPKFLDDPALVKVRQVQLSLGDIGAKDAQGTAFEGYTARKPIPAERVKEVGAKMTATFLTEANDLNRESLRTAAMAGTAPPEMLSKLGAYLNRTRDPLDDIHALICLARLDTPWPAGYADIVATALLRLDEKIEKAGLTRDRHWPLRITETAVALAKRDPDLSAALLRSPLFGRANHVLFVGLPGFDRAAAAKRFTVRSPDFAWQPEHVALFADDRPALLLAWDHGGLEDAVVQVLAKKPLFEDRAKFVRGLASLKPSAAVASARALAALKANEPAEVAAILRAARRLTDTDAAHRSSILESLRAVTGANPGADVKAWESWASSQPAVAAKLAGAGINVATWKARSARIPWAAGDPVRGQKVFAKATCAACHNGGTAVGPALDGVTKRFGRDDLLTSIIDPNRDVSPRYRTVEVSTTDGKSFVGVVVYEAVDGLILQTGPDETARVSGSKIEAKRSRDGSLMPAGLLDPLADAEVADLFAYLGTLGGR